MKREQLLTTWTNLKTKLTKPIYLLKKQELIKEAVNFHLLQASSFSMGERYGIEDVPQNYTPTTLTEPSVPQFDSSGKLRAEWKDYLKRKSWNSYFKQREENERIVRECKEVLGKLS